jgi:hypothetical protein
MGSSNAELLRNGPFHGAHETCRLLVMIIKLFGAVIISDQARPVVPQLQKTCNSVRSESAKQIETA